MAKAVGGETGAEELGARGKGNSLLSDQEVKPLSLVSQLRGVPKGTLMTVLGKQLGSQVWEQVRDEIGSTRHPVADAEVVTGLVAHLAREAARQVCAGERCVKFVQLVVYGADGACATGRARLPWLTQDAREIARTALRIFDSLGVAPARVRSLSLDVTVTTAKVSEPRPVAAWQTTAVMA